MTNLISKTELSELSKVENIKVESQGLYGTLDVEMSDKDLACFNDDNVQVMKHHGTYQQDNRDVRTERRRAGLDKDWCMMVRTKTPGGRMTAEQYLLCDDLCDKYGQGDLRITSRQGFQFHGVVKKDLRALIHDLNKLQSISTQGACGDVVRNVMCSPVADIDPKFAGISADLQAMTQKISDHFLTRSNSYYDLWLNDERATVDADGNVLFSKTGAEQAPEEPIYGKQYLPRKFKIAITADFDNSVDALANDGVALAVTENGAIKGFEILAGGGMGHNHSKKETYPRLATPVTFVSEEKVLPVIEAIVKVQRDYGNRADRQQARLKYTMDQMGTEKFRALVAEYAGFELPEPSGALPTAQPHYLGWAKQSQPGLNYVGVWVENGRVKDFDGKWQFRSGLRKIVERFRPSVRLTAHHNIVLANIRDEDVDAVQALLKEHNIPTDKGVSKLRFLEMACPALPLCGLALAEAERELPSIIDAIEAEGHGNEEVIIRMTGCPNSCARPKTAEIGLIGRGPKKYNVYVGGDKLGTRMNELLVESVAADVVPILISRLLSKWKAERANGEDFGDYSNRIGVEQLQDVVSASV